MKCNILILLFLFIACNQKKTKVEYYTNGNLRIKCEIVDNLRNGTCVEYFESGNVKSIAYWKNDTLNGEAKYFFETGNLEMSCYWKKGKLDSVFTEYYQNGKMKTKKYIVNGETVGPFVKYYLDGKPEIIRNNILVYNKSFVNEVYTLSPNGDTIIPKSNFFVIKQLHDTIKLGERFNATIWLKAPHFYQNEMYVYFEIPNDSVNYKRVLAHNYMYEYSYLPKDTGTYRMKGFIEEVAILNKGNDSITKELRDLYFETRYYVKSPPR